MIDSLMKEPNYLANYRLAQKVQQIISRSQGTQRGTSLRDFQLLMEGYRTVADRVAHHPFIGPAPLFWTDEDWNDQANLERLLKAFMSDGVRKRTSLFSHITYIRTALEELGKPIDVLTGFISTIHPRNGLAKPMKLVLEAIGASGLALPQVINFLRRRQYRDEKKAR